MSQFFSKRRLKIAEQIIIVSFFAVLIPMTVSGIIINNINQQSNTAQRSRCYDSKHCLRRN